MLWIAVIFSFLAVVLNLCVFLQNAISYFRIEHLHQAGTVMVGFEDYGKYSLIALGLMLFFIIIMILIEKTTCMHTETSIYKVQNNSVCLYRLGLFVDTISFFYYADTKIKNKFVYCKREQITLEYNKKEPFVEVTLKHRKGNWIANLMLFSFMDRDIFCKVNMPANRIQYMK